jgi:GNAT superfamily N-acetyltransferase
MKIAALTIRAAKIQDASRVHDLHAASVRALCAGHYSDEIIEGWLMNRTPDGYLRPIERGTLFVAEQDGRVIGFGEASPGTVIAIYVDPAHIRHGVGSAILEKAMSMARTNQNGPIRLEATLNARAFYEHAGFREVGRSTAKRNHVDVPIAIMEHD